MLDELFHGSFLRDRERLQVPVVEDDQLELAKIFSRAVRRPPHFELVGFEGIQQMLFSTRRILCNQQHLRAAQSDRLLEAGFPQIGGGDLTGQIHRAHRADAGVHAEMIEARLDLDAAGPQGLAFGGDLDLGGRPPRRIESDVDGKALPAEDLRRQAERLEAQVGLGASSQRVRVDGDAQLPRLPGCTHDAAQILIAVGDQNEARNQAGGQRGGAIPYRRLEVGRVAAVPARVLQAPRFAALLGSGVASPARERDHTGPAAAPLRLDPRGQIGSARQILRAHAGRGVHQDSRRYFAFVHGDPRFR